MATSILIVEDQTRLAAAMGAILRAAGFEVGAYPSVDEGLRALDGHTVDAAILDINVEDGLVFPLADELDARGIPYAFCSSIHPEDRPARHARAPFLRKPFDLDELLTLTATLFARLPQGYETGHENAQARRSARG